MKIQKIQTSNNRKNDSPGNNKLMNAWIKLNDALKTDTDNEEEKSPNEIPNKNLLLNLKNQQDYRSPLLQNKAASNSNPLLLPPNTYSSQKNFPTLTLPARPMSSQPGVRPLSSSKNQYPPTAVSSIRSLLNLKAMSRPHSRPGTANPRVPNKHLEALTNISEEEFEILKRKTERIHSLFVDEILDLYTARCFDNKAEYMPEQAVKFIEKFKKQCINEKLILRYVNYFVLKK